MEDSGQKPKNHKLQAMRNRIKLNTPLLINKQKSDYLQASSPSPCTPHHQSFPSPHSAFKFEGFAHFASLSQSGFYLKNAFEEEYEILQKLGEGANGVVRKCMNRVTKEISAVKIGKMQEQHKINLMRIVKFMQKLQHDNILQCKQFYHDPKRSKYYHVIQYIPHPSLKSLLQQKHQFSPSTLKTIMKQLFSALEYFHKHHIVHRDIKTSNILFDVENNKLTVIDLGIITKTVHRGKRRNLWSNNGTLEYKAPQMLLGSSYNESVDVWAAGVVLYQLVEGRTPFKEQSHFDIIDNITEIKYSFNQELWKDIPLAKLLVIMLLKSKSQRLTAREAQKAPWFQVIGENEKDHKVSENKKGGSKEFRTVNSFNPWTRLGLAGSVLIVKNANEEDVEQHEFEELTISNPFNLRMSSYESTIEKQDNALSLSDILGTKEQTLIINNNS